MTNQITYPIVIPITAGFLIFVHTYSAFNESNTYNPGAGSTTLSLLVTVDEYSGLANLVASTWIRARSTVADQNRSRATLSK